MTFLYQYFSLVRDWQTMLSPAAFPFPVDVDYGIAAIAYTPNADHDPRGDDTTALLGCGCVDGSSGLVITCAVAPFNGQVSPRTSAPQWARPCPPCPALANS